MEELQEQKESKMVCVYCNAYFTPKMEMDIVGSASGCESCGYGGYTEYEISIHCESCGRLVYKKEGRKDN